MPAKYISKPEESCPASQEALYCASKMKTNIHYGAVYYQVGQQALNGIAESFKSFQELINSHKKGEIENRPRPPRYRKSKGMAVATYPKQALKLVGKQVRDPLGQLCKTWFGLEAFWLTMASNQRFEDIKEVRILPRNRCFYAEWVYIQKTASVELDRSRSLGIDSGLVNWLTWVSNINTSFIIDGRHIKSLNQWDNKSVAKIKEGKPQGFWSKRLAYLTEKRNRQMGDAVNKAARIVINHCRENKIGRSVFGWNQGIKEEINIGKRNNQSFVRPRAKLKSSMQELCEQYGIQFIETEEANTSAASFLDGDTVAKYGEKPETWKSEGKRVKRGCNGAGNNFYINADANGAANMLRKVAGILGLDLSKLSRGTLTSPPRIFLWKLASTKRSNVQKCRGFASL